MACAQPGTSSRRGSSSSRRTRRSATLTTWSIQAGAFSSARRARAWRSSPGVGAAPPFEQRPALAVNRVQTRHRKLADVMQRPPAVLRSGAAHVRVLSAGVGAHHHQIGTGSLILVGDAGWYHDDVAGMQFYDRAGFAAEPHPNRAGRDPQHLVCGAVIMVVRVNSVAPTAAPAILGEQLLAVGGASGAGLDRSAIDKHRQ